MPIKVIARVMGHSKNTVRSALAFDVSPQYERVPSGSIVDEVEPRIRELLAAWPTMPATVIAERIGWSRSIRVLSGRVAELRPVYLPPDPAGRTSYVAGEIGQHDFWFPNIELPVGFGQTRTAKQLPVLTMITGYSRWLPRTCSPVGGATSPRWVRSRGCWSGMAKARSGGGAAGAASSPATATRSAERSGRRC
jgi:transposase